MNASNSKAYTIPDVDSMSATLTSPLHLAPLEDKAILVDFDGGRLSSDGGLILLSDPDEQMGLTRDLAAVLRDPRDPRRVNFLVVADHSDNMGFFPRLSTGDPKMLADPTGKR